MDDQDLEFQEAVKERFALLPKPVQNAILSADVSKHLRALAQNHQLHVDQWNDLETEVQMTLMGMHRAEELEQNIKKVLATNDETAAELADEIYQGVFEPIRTELEQQLTQTSPEATLTPPPTAPAPAITPSAPPQTVAPATPPPEPLGATALREVLSKNYQQGGMSHERKEIDGDPYREQLL